MRTGLLLGAAVLALSVGGQVRAEVPGDLSTKATLTVTKAPQPENFDSLGDKDWFRVQLKAGSDYVIAVGCSVCDISLRDATGRKVLAKSGANEIANGVEYRAPKTATYIVTAQEKDQLPFRFPDTYVLWVAPDCRRDALTKCSIAPGGHHDGVFTVTDDGDAFTAKLKAGVRYTARLHIGATDYGSGIGVSDKQGHSVAEGVQVVYGDHEVYDATFVAPKTGVYVIGCGADSRGDDIPYSVDLYAGTAPPPTR